MSTYHNATDGGQESAIVSYVDILEATPTTGPFVYLTGRRMGWMRWCPFAEPITIVCMTAMRTRLPPCVVSDLSTCGWSGSITHCDVETEAPHPTKEKDEHD